MALRDRLVAAWYARSPGPLALALLPLAVAFRGGVALRRALYRARILECVRVAAPVIVVGNVTVGGTGKTPLALALADALAVRGRHPGIVSRGYGGRHAERGKGPRIVLREDDPGDVGDEPLLYASRGFAVAIGRDRAAAAQCVLAHDPRVDVLIADDGLQHYRLARDVEIAVVDGARGLGNGLMLPAGPLREPRSRLAEVAFVVVTEAPEGAADLAAELPDEAPRYAQRLVPDESLYRVADPGAHTPVSVFRGKRVHAVAGIGRPERFFATLEQLGLAPIPHPYPDHHRFVPQDLAFAGPEPVVMTAKDAVKCRAFADPRCWYLPVRAEIPPELTDAVERMIRGPEAP